MKIIFAFLLMLPVSLFSQDISGIWSGWLRAEGSDVSFEMAISGTEEKLSGYSMMVFSIKGVENVGVKSIVIRNKLGNVTFEDDQLLYNNYSTSAKRTKLIGELTLNKTDTIMTLSGSFYTRQIDLRSNKETYKGTIQLKRLRNPDQSKLLAQLAKLDLLHTLSFLPPDQREKKAVAEQPVKINKPVEEKPVRKPEVAVNKGKPAKVNTKEKAQPKIATPPATKVVAPEVVAAAAIKERKTEVIRTIFFKSDSLVLSLYDNGTVDGDTVSLVLNGNVIVARKQLSTKAIRTVIPVSAATGDSLLLTMYAENLGAIPPNTGLLIIQDGNTRSEIRFEGDLNKSSAVVLKRRR